LADRIKQDNWAPTTVNLMRQILHKLFAYAIKHHGFRSRDRRYPNPVTGVDRLREPAAQGMDAGRTGETHLRESNR
jgi:hypothetical protein